MDKNLAILFLHGDHYPTSRSEMIELFEREMVRRGHRIHYVMLTEVCGKEKVKDCGNNVYHLIPAKNGLLSKMHERDAVARISKKIVQEESIDIIQVRDDIFLSKLAISLSKKHDIPFVFRLSTLFHSLDKDLIKYRKSFGNVLRYVRGIYGERIYRKLIRRSHLFLPISKAMEEHYRSEFPEKKMMPLPLQAPHSFIRYNKKHDKPRSKKRIIYIGQISYIRNMEFMIDVISKLSDDVEMMFVGPPQQDFIVKDMKEHARKLGVEDRVVFVGKVDKDEIPKYITSAHVGVSPIPPLKAFRMSSPTKVVEYLSLGVPVVANKEIQDQRYVIENSGGGFAVEYDVDKFSDKVEQLLTDPSKAKTMGKKGKGWIKRHRNYKLLAKKLEGAYHEILGSSH